MITTCAFVEIKVLPSLSLDCCKFGAILQNVQKTTVSEICHAKDDLKTIVQMQVYQMVFICGFIAIVGPENDQLLKSSIYSVFCI